MVVIKIDGGIYMKDRVEVLKSYLQRLGKGESLESVRADFVKEFAEVDDEGGDTDYRGAEVM